MSQLIAGEILTFTVDGMTITAKIEDASKSDMFSAKIERVVPASETYRVDGVYEFSRNLLKP